LIQPIVANALQTEDLDRFNRAAAGREDRVIQVKQEVNELLIELGRQPRYASTYEVSAGAVQHGDSLPVADAWRGVAEQPADSQTTQPAE
jgi:hypothetical protein